MWTGNIVWLRWYQIFVMQNWFPLLTKMFLPNIIFTWFYMIINILLQSLRELLECIFIKISTLFQNCTCSDASQLYLSTYYDPVQIHPFLVRCQEQGNLIPDELAVTFCNHIYVFAFCHKFIVLHWKFLRSVACIKLNKRLRKCIHVCLQTLLLRNYFGQVRLLFILPETFVALYMLITYALKSQVLNRINFEVF